MSASSIEPEAATVTEGHIPQSTEPTRPLSPLETFGYSVANVGYGSFFALNNFILPLYLDHFTKSNVLIGLLSSSDSIEGAVIQPIVGSASDRMRSKWGRRRPFMLVCIPLSALFVALTVGAGHLPGSVRLAAIVGCVFLFTLLFTIAWDPYQALMPDITPTAQRGRVMAISTLFGMVGQVILLFTPIPIPAKFVLSAVLMIVMTLVTCVMIKEPPPPDGPPGARRHSHLAELKTALQGLRTLRQAGKALTVLFLSGLGIGAVFPFLTKFLKIIVGATEAQAQQIPVVLMVSGALTVVLFGKMTDRYGPKRVNMIGLGLTVLAALNGLWIHTYWQAVGVMVLAGVGNAALSAARYPLLTELVPAEEVGFYTGLQTTAMALALPVTSVLTGQLIDMGGGYRIIFCVCAVGVTASMFVLANIQMKSAVGEIMQRNREQGREAQAG